MLQPLPTDLTDQLTKPVEKVEVLDDIRPVVPIFKAGWPDYGVDTCADGGTCTIVACNSLVAAGALAGLHMSYVLKKEEMAGNGELPYYRCAAEIVEHWRRNPLEVTPYVQFLLDSIGDVMTTNNKVKTVIQHYFNVEDIEVLCVNVNKEAKAKARKETKANARLQQPAGKFVSRSMIIHCPN